MKWVIAILVILGVSYRFFVAITPPWLDVVFIIGMAVLFVIGILGARSRKPDQ